MIKVLVTTRCDTFTSLPHLNAGRWWINCRVCTARPSAVGSSEAMIKMLGFGLGVAVLLDAFVVRMAVVPAALALLGRAAWWLPRGLAAILPDLDIEGTRLHDRPGEDAAAHDPSLARM